MFKTKNRIVYLSRQSNEKSLDMILLEKQISKLSPETEQVFRLKMIDDDFSSKFKYCFHLIGDMYCLATSKVAICDTYSIPVSCLKHKKSLKVIQLWHALGAVKKFGLQSLGTKEGRDPKISKAMCMHQNYDYVMAPSKKSALFYAEAFGCEKSKIKISSLPHIDYLLDRENSRSKEFFEQNPDCTAKKNVLYLPTFRDREEYIANELKVAFEDDDSFRLIIQSHPLSSASKDEKYSCKGDFSTFDLLKIADYIITDYSACAFEAAVLMKPLYFFVPDYDIYQKERGLNIDLKKEMGFAVFENSQSLYEAIKSKPYDFDKLYKFKSDYVENTKSNNAEVLAKFVVSLL